MQLQITMPIAQFKTHCDYELRRNCPDQNKKPPDENGRKVPRPTPHHHSFMTMKNIFSKSFDLALPQIYIFHIYTGPKFTKPTFTQTQIYTAQIYTHQNLHSHILANPNLHNSNLHQTEPKFTKTQIYIVLNCARCKTGQNASFKCGYTSNAVATGALSFLS